MIDIGRTVNDLLLTVRQLQDDISQNNNLLNQMSLTIRQQNMIIFVMFIILIMLSCEVFELTQHRIKTITSQHNEELNIKYIKENEKLKKRIDFLEHDC